RLKRLLTGPGAIAPGPVAFVGPSQAVNRLERDALACAHDSRSLFFPVVHAFGWSNLRRSRSRRARNRSVAASTASAIGGSISVWLPSVTRSSREPGHA